MTASDALSRLRAGLDRDEAIAREAIGTRGRETGATVQHWQWARERDDTILTDGRDPIAAEHLYSDDIANPQPEQTGIQP
ncbi:hypothetical protein CRM89_00250 [Nocardia sp. FDAARGOS_372]|uniref:hypothetical protein n=1 Tax=Nocardia sp. FDAARGOS_372 TaxID=2018066 RepID=UPI000BF20648|nr:hypothetical protein [Nocardia sp. FDAARGOS_372]PEH74618.1 hypothetical protein CRM89_00250 [Nocardia sp. FDAARGOS_372]